MSMTEDERRYYYQWVFKSEKGVKVLEDLAEFAHADRAEFCVDPRKETYLNGRRSVICEIRKLLSEKENNNGLPIGKQSDLQ